MRGNRLVTASCICLLASTGLSCRPEEHDADADAATLTLLVLDQDERALGPLGASPWFLVLLGLTDGLRAQSPITPTSPPARRQAVTLPMPSRSSQNSPVTFPTRARCFNATMATTPLG